MWCTEIHGMPIGDICEFQCIIHQNYKDQTMLSMATSLCPAWPCTDNTPIYTLDISLSGLNIFNIVLCVMCLYMRGQFYFILYVWGK